MKTKRTLLSTISSDPPKEFRIFKRGMNETSKGELLFDDKAAVIIMAEFKKRGRDYPIDLEHLSIDQENPAYDPDARGWFKLALRNGELWAVDVRWAPDGKQRLRNLTQRYVSPFIEVEEDTGRVVSLFNVAICAAPATYDAPALVAASLHSGKKFVTLSVEATKMDDMKKVLAALGLGEDATLEDCLSSIKALQDSEGGEGSGDGEESLADDEEKKDGDDDGEKKKPYADDEKKDDDGKDKEAMKALSSAVVALSAQVAALTKKQDVETVEALIEKNTDKIPLSLEGWAKTQTPKQLKAFLSAMPSNPRPKQESKQGGDVEPTLTEEEKSVALSAGIDPKMVLERKKQKFTEAKERARTPN